MNFLKDAKKKKMKGKELKLKRKIKNLKMRLFYKIGHIFYKINKLRGYFLYVQKIGFKKYWRYLRIITLMKVLGFRTLPEFDELIKTLDVFTYVMAHMGITVKEFGELLKKYSENKGEIYKQELEKNAHI